MRSQIAGAEQGEDCLLHRLGVWPAVNLAKREGAVDHLREMGGRGWEYGEERGRGPCRSHHQLLVHRRGFVYVPARQKLEECGAYCPEISLCVDFVRSRECLLRR